MAVSTPRPALPEGTTVEAVAHAGLMKQCSLAMPDLRLDEKDARAVWAYLRAAARDKDEKQAKKSGEGVSLHLGL